VLASNATATECHRDFFGRHPPLASSETLNPAK
jgi:hypothetical protein